MAFTKEATKTPAGIGKIQIELMSAPQEDATQPSSKGISFQVQIIYSDESVQWRSGNLLPHLTQQQITQLSAFLDTMRTKANAEFIG